MKTPFALTLAGAALALLALAGCATPASTSSSSPPPIAAGTDAAVATTDLGTIVVDGKGMTAYFFDKDTADSGSSACTGQCAANWPAITSASATPSVTGITAKVGTITGVTGDKQLTVNGRPIYTYAGDTAAGDTNGQGVQGVWYVLSPAGDEITTKPGRSGY
ncbi:hypothetical protein [Cryobacterium tagatosivorans]|uniref:COG4315 family predicted lipoprotein n=1 Tax=Cryobacterium tagatosivorans TaxID=1259199 RepID=UPI0030BA1CE6